LKHTIPLIPKKEFAKEEKNSGEAPWLHGKNVNAPRERRPSHVFKAIRPVSANATEALDREAG
jgi:hypothetical protein